MRGRFSSPVFAVAILAGALLVSCAAGRQLITQGADPGQVQGTYRLLLYGCHYPDEVENAALLISTTSRYPVEIYDLPTSYRETKDVPAAQALREADAFVRCSTHRLWRTEIRRIPDGSGGTIGYEVRPIYNPLEFGITDVLVISYALRDGVVRARIKLNPALERERDFPDGRDASRDLR